MDATSIVMIPVEDILPSPVQPRARVEVDDLKQSLTERGVQSPVVVYQDDKGRYRVWQGERRWRAAGLEALPCIVKPKPAFLDFLSGAVSENEQRQPLRNDA